MPVDVTCDLLQSCVTVLSELPKSTQASATLWQERPYSDLPAKTAFVQLEPLHTVLLVCL